MSEQNEHAEALRLTAAKLLRDDARFVAGHIFTDFLSGLDVPSMDPGSVDEALSSYVVGQSGLRRNDTVRYVPGIRVSQTLDVMNSYEFSIEVTKSDYLVNFLYVPLVKACPSVLISPSEVVCEDGVLRLVYETEIYSHGMSTPTDAETETICMDPLRRVRMAEEAIAAAGEALAERDDVVRRVIDAYRTRWERAKVAVEVARNLKVA